MQYSNARYMIYLNDSFGNRVSELNVADVSQFIRFRAVRTVNNVGALTIRFTGGSQEPAFLPILERLGLLRKDSIIEIWRTTGMVPSLLLDMVWYVRSIQRMLSADGTITIELTAFDSLYLLAGRLCLDVTSRAQNQLIVEGRISEIMTELVFINARATAILGNARRIPNLRVALQSFNEDVSINIDISKGNLLSVLQNLSEMSITKGVPVYFDIECNAANSMLFNIYANQRGVDRRTFQTGGDGRSSIINTNSGIIREMTMLADWTDEVTAVYPWGNNGTAALGFLTDPINQVSPYSTPFAWREAISEGGNTNSQETEFLAYSLLQNRRGTWNVSATLQDTSDFLYGRDWGFGDRIYINAFGAIMDTRINSVEFVVEEKQEIIRIALTVTEDMI